MAPTMSLVMQTWCKKGRFHGEENRDGMACKYAVTTVLEAMEGDGDDDDDGGYDYAPAA